MQSRNNRIALSECAMRYALALTNPFSNNLKEVCIPDEWAQPSYKVAVRAFTTLVTGTGGWGWVIADPQAISNDAANNARAILSTTAAYVGSQSRINILDPDLLKVNATRAPYSQATLISQTGPKYRIVACGLRIRYTGKAIDRGGTIIALRHPNNETLNDLDESQLRGLNNSVPGPVHQDKWTSVNWIPVNASNQAFKTYDPSSYTHSMGFFVRSATPGATFEVQAMYLTEYVGANIATTPSHSDTVGMAAIRNSLPERIITESTDYTQTLFNGIQDYLLAGASVAAAALPGTYAASQMFNGLMGQHGKQRMRLEL